MSCLLPTMDGTGISVHVSVGDPDLKQRVHPSQVLMTTFDDFCRKFGCGIVGKPARMCASNCTSAYKSLYIEKN